MLLNPEAYEGLIDEIELLRDMAISDAQIAAGQVIPHSPDDLDALRAGAEAFGLTFEQALAHLGATTRGTYLNDVAYWRNVPAGVWSYTIGGYQVMKKWLSYRERSLLGCDLSKDEAREVANIVP